VAPPKKTLKFIFQGFFIVLRRLKVYCIHTVGSNKKAIEVYINNETQKYRIYICSEN